MNLMWLSFAEDSEDDPDGKFNGLIITEGTDLIECVKKTHILSINPGGQVLGHPIPRWASCIIPPFMLDFLFQKEEAIRLANFFDDLALKRQETFLLNKTEDN